MTLAKGRCDYPVTIHPPDTIGDGSKDVASAGTAEKLVDDVTDCRLVNIYAKSGNTGNVFVGGATVSSSRGMVLEQARSSDWFPIDDLSKIYVDAANNGDGVQFSYVV